MALSSKWIAFAAIGLLASEAAFASADTDYLERYVGDWKGGGSVQVQQLPKPTDVSCNSTGSIESADTFKLSGKCSAFLVFSNEVSAELTLDPETGRYTGTYTGSKSGPAKLAGTRDGDTLDLVVTWQKKIYDDDTAKMTIENGGDGKFVLKVVEKIDGKDVTVSDLNFHREKN